MNAPLCCPHCGATVFTLTLPAALAAPPPASAPAPPAEPLVLRVAEAGALLGISERSTYELIAAGRLRTVRLNSRIRVPRAAVEEYVQQLAREQDDADAAAAAFAARLRRERR